MMRDSKAGKGLEFGRADDLVVIEDCQNLVTHAQSFELCSSRSEFKEW
jgi:hypothetical protein